MGVMSFAHLHAEAYARALGERLAGVWDPDAERGRAAAERHRTRLFGGREELLAAVDAVVVTSENAHHADHVLAAATAGKHVLCEKPLATTIADAERMVAACASAGVKLQTAFPCPFSPAFNRMRELIRAGELGELLALACTNHGQMPGGWFVERSLSGGGAVMDHTVHVADLLRRLVGPIVSVYAEVGDGLHHRGIDDCGLLTFQLAGGVVATLDTSWSRPGGFPTWGDVTIRAVGSRGTLAMDMFGEVVELYGREQHGQIGFGADLNRMMVEDFVQAIELDRPVSVTGEDGVRALEVALAAYRSAETGRPVSLSSGR